MSGCVLSVCMVTASECVHKGGEKVRHLCEVVMMQSSVKCETRKGDVSRCALWGVVVRECVLPGVGHDKCMHGDDKKVRHLCEVVMMQTCDACEGRGRG